MVKSSLEKVYGRFQNVWQRWEKLLMFFHGILRNRQVKISFIITGS